MEEKTEIAPREKKPRHTALLVFACAVLLTVVTVLCLGGNDSGIALPTGSAAPMEQMEQDGYQLTNASITTDNVQQVIASMSRPKAYTASVTNTLYWSGSWSLGSCNRLCRSRFFSTSSCVIKTLSINT